MHMHSMHKKVPGVAFAFFAAALFGASTPFSKQLLRTCSR